MRVDGWQPRNKQSVMRGQLLGHAETQMREDNFAELYAPDLEEMDEEQIAAL